MRFEKDCCQTDHLGFCQTSPSFLSRTHAPVFAGDSTKTMPRMVNFSCCHPAKKLMRRKGKERERKRKGEEKERKRKGRISYYSLLFLNLNKAIHVSIDMCCTLHNSLQANARLNSAPHSTSEVKVLSAMVLLNCPSIEESKRFLTVLISSTLKDIRGRHQMRSTRRL